MAWIYKITAPNRKIYIGSTKNIKQRWLSYKYGHCKAQRKIYDSLVKFGFNRHKFEIITECDEGQRYIFEKVYGDLYASKGIDGLNICLPSGKEITPKKDLSGDLRIREWNLKSKEFQLFNWQKKLLRRFVFDLNMDPKFVIEHSLRVYYENKYDKLYTKLFNL